MDLAAAQPITGTKAGDLILDLPLQGFEPLELVPPLGHGTQVVAHQGTDRATPLGGGYLCVAVHVVGNGDRNVLHSFTVTLAL